MPPPEPALTEPQLSVVVASHFRPLRLRWLLNALAEQTLARSEWEVIVGHDSDEATERLLTEHPLAASGVLRHVRQPPGVGTIASNRNAALTLARAPVIVFTDDDCRPPPRWLESVREAVRRRPGAILQGPVASDPDEAVMLRSPYPRTQHFSDVPRIWGECCNIVYPRALLDQLGGFADEGWLTCEDTDLLLRALAAGAGYAGAQGMGTYHCVEEGNLLDALRGTRRWRFFVDLVARHPELREHLFARYFWKETHAWLLVALLGVAGARRRPAMAVLIVPWIRARPVRGGGWRGALRHLLELPGFALTDAVEIGVLARASARIRVPVL